jgi:DNA mismatch repair protein MutS
MAEELPLFAQAEPEPETQPEMSALEAALSKIDPDALTPRQALEILYKIKGLADRP